MIENFINGFISEVKRPNIFLFSLILANKFKGEVLIKDEIDESMPDIVVLIGNDIYDMFGKIDNGIVNIDEYVVLDRMNLLFNIKFYNYSKWSFVYEENDDEMYYNDVN
jgi:hypothetical protein